MLNKPNAVDISQFAITTSKEEVRKELKLPSGKKIILYAGHLFKWKGVNTLLEAHRFLKKDEHIYFVGGTDEDIESMKKKATALKTENVSIVGRKSHQEMPLWYKGADVLILPNTAKDDTSKFETSPVKLFEYMASGVPIVVSDLPSIRNIVDEKMVWFFEPDNPKSLADTIHIVMERYDDAYKKTQEAKEEVAKHTWEKRINGVISFIKATKSKS